MKISIVTPTFNSGKYLKSTLDSIHNQKYESLEHYVFDSMSTDDTKQMLSDFEGNITWLSEKDGGQSEAINKGFKLVSGDIVAWQNADDLYELDTFEYISRFFVENPNVGLVYGAYHEIDEEGNRICTVRTKKWREKKFVRGRFCPVQPTVFWKKEVLDRVGFLDESLNYCMDVDFYSRALNLGFKIVGVEKVLGSFRVHRESKTQNRANRLAHKNEYLKVLKSNFNYTKFDRALFELYYLRSQMATKIKRLFDL